MERRTNKATAFRRQDETPDAQFYVQPRLVTHIDPGAVGAVTALYRELIPAGGAVLDLMTSWLSHLPSEVAYARVAGLGMNAAELAANPRLTERAVQDLNADPVLPYGGGEFDAATICVSVQYLVRPVEVFTELARVLKPGAPLIVTFSNRCFPTKAVFEWLVRDTAGHVDLVTSYLRDTRRFGPVEVRSHLPRGADPLIGVIARRIAAP